MQTRCRDLGNEMFWLEGKIPKKEDDELVARANEGADEKRSSLVTSGYDLQTWGEPAAGS